MKRSVGDPLGLAEGAVALSTHREEWGRLYAAEAEALRRALGDRARDIRHIGSTAIAGLKAKPILDIMVGLERLDVALECVSQLGALGYEHMGDGIVPEDHIFGKGQPRTHLAHLVEHGGRHWSENLIFLERLRTDADLRRAYEALKTELAAKHPSDRPAYTAAKAAFIQSVVAGRNDPDD